MSVITQQFSVGGMRCPGCESVIEEAISRIHGVHRVRADYARESVAVTFDSRKAKPEHLLEVIEQAGYTCTANPSDQHGHFVRTLLSALLGLGGIALILVAGEWVNRIHLPGLDQHLSYGLLFLVGLLSGFHCVGMCGGFVLGYTARNAALGRHSLAFSHLMYGIGKMFSYTAIGGMFGLLGSVIAFTPLLRGIAGVVAGSFLVLMGLSMLKVFPALRLGLRMPNVLRRFIHGEARRHRGPLAFGLLNGLMIACGPLQAMYVMAAGTGSFVEGAKRLFVFGAGTLPMLLGFGMMTSLVSHRASERILKLSAVFVMIIGLIMVNRGLVLTGTGYDVNTMSAVARVEFSRWIDLLRARMPAEGDYQTIHMTVTQSGYRPNSFVLRQGIPVKWVIDGRELTHCNERLLVPALGLDILLVKGTQTVEFVPAESGVIPWSCWMGMLPGSFVVQPAEGGDHADTGGD